MSSHCLSPRQDTSIHHQANFSDTPNCVCLFHDLALYAKYPQNQLLYMFFVLPRPCRGFDMLETSLSNFVTMLYRGLPIDNAECQVHWRASDIRHT